MSSVEVSTNQTSADTAHDPGGSASAPKATQRPSGAQMGHGGRSHAIERDSPGRAGLTLGIEFGDQQGGVPPARLLVARGLPGREPRGVRGEGGADVAQTIVVRTDHAGVAPVLA